MIPLAAILHGPEPAAADPVPPVVRGSRRGRAAFLALALATGAQAAPPELGFELCPGSGPGGATESQSGAAGPIQGTATQNLPGLTSDGAASADYGVLTARTATSVDASAPSSAFCVAPHGSDAEAFWSDRLIFSSPGVARGTLGSFTAQMTLDGNLAATLAPTWTFVAVGSLYDTRVEIDGVLWERIGASCAAIPLPGYPCIPVPLATATVTPESGVDWLKTVPVPEPRGELPLGLALLLAGLASWGHGAARAPVRSAPSRRRRPPAGG